MNLPENKARSSSVDSDKQQTLEEKRRGRFIVLGSSGECLPVNRPRSASLKDKAESFFANGDDESSDDDDEIFYSARNSLNDDEVNSDDEFFDHQRYSIELETPENRMRFAQQLKDALKLENGYTESTEECSIDEDEFGEEYAVDINVEGMKKLSSFNPSQKNFLKVHECMTEKSKSDVAPALALSLKRRLHSMTFKCCHEPICKDLK